MTERLHLRLGGVPEHFNLPWHLAIEDFAASGDLGPGVEVSWEDQHGGTGAMLAGLEAGELDLVSILTEGTVLAIEQGAAITILQVYVQSPLRWGVHVPAASSIIEESELDGARIAISRFRSGSHLMAFVLGERLGHQISDEQFVLIGNLDGAREAFANGDADLFLWDRYMTQVLVDKGEFRRIGVQETPWPSFVVAARNEVIAEAPDQVTAIVDAVVGHAVALHDRPEIVDELTSRYEISELSAREWLDATTFAPAGPVDQAMLADTLATLRRAGFGAD